jgi:hypothetical protein
MAEEDKKQEQTEEETFSRNSESIIFENQAGRLSRLLRLLYFSRACRIIYLLLLVVNVAMGVWVVVDAVRRRSPAQGFYVLEFTVNSILLLDVFMRLCLHGCRRYWCAKTNVFEFVIVWVCMIISILSIIRTLELTSK